MTALASLPERSTVISRRLSGPLRRSVTTGGVIAATLASLSPVLFADLAWPLRTAVGVVVGSVAGLVVARAIFPRQLVGAFEAFSWLGRTELDRFADRTGSRFPTDLQRIAPWLAALPDTEATRPARIEVLAFLGRLDEARAVLEAAVPPADPAARAEHASLAQYVDWLAGGPGDLGELRAAVAQLPAGSHERAMGEVSIAVAQARALAVAGDRAWWRPLQEVRPGLGREPVLVTWRDTWLPMLAAVASVAVAASILLLLLELVV